jgi:hypothetical protein
VVEYAREEVNDAWTVRGNEDERNVWTMAGVELPLGEVPDLGEVGAAVSGNASCHLCSDAAALVEKADDLWKRRGRELAHVSGCRDITPVDAVLHNFEDKFGNFP